MTVTASLDAPELVRLCANALAFVPLRDATAELRIRFDWDTIEAAGTDTYTAGFDIAESDCDGEATFHVSRESLQLVEKAARGSKKAAVTLTLYPGDSVTFRDGGGDPVTVPVVESYDPRLWPRVDELMRRLEASEYVMPRSIAFDAAKLARFSKVKADKDAAMDLLMQGAEDPVLVRIGSTFRGCIMPVDRGVYEEFAGTDAAVWQAS